MVIDPSAILAILQNEPERGAFNAAIAAADQRRLSAASLVELSIVVEARCGIEGQNDLDLFLATANVAILPFNADQAQIARSAFRRFGKGRHPAGLNLVDCYSYALAQFCAAPLLFKGNDFGLTDVQAAIA